MKKLKKTTQHQKLSGRAFVISQPWDVTDTRRRLGWSFRGLGVVVGVVGRRQKKGAPKRRALCLRLDQINTVTCEPLSGCASE